MDFKVTVWACIAGCSLQARLSIDYASLVQAFGEPLTYAETVEDYWDIKFADGTVASIYDPDAEGFPTNETTNWSVGARGYKGLEYVLQVLDKKGIDYGLKTQFGL